MLHLMVKRSDQSAKWKSISKATQEVLLLLTLTGPQVLCMCLMEFSSIKWVEPLSSYGWNVLALICVVQSTIAFLTADNCSEKCGGNDIYCLACFGDLPYWRNWNMHIIFSINLVVLTLLCWLGVCPPAFQVHLCVSTVHVNADFCWCCEHRWKSKAIIKIKFKRKTIQWHLRGQSRASSDQALKASSLWHCKGHCFSSCSSHREKRQRSECMLFISEI